MAGRTLTAAYVVDASGVGRGVKTAGASLDKLGGDAEHTSGRIRHALGGALGSIGGAFGGALEPLQAAFANIDGAMDTMSEKGRTVGKASLAAGAGAIGLGAMLTQAGSADASAQAQLQQSIADTGRSYDDYKDRIDHTVTSMTKYGYTANQVDNALQGLTQSTGDPAKAIDLMGEAANLAAARHEDLGQAVTQLNQVIAGKGTRTLQQFGITLTNSASATKAAASAEAAVTKAEDGYAKAKQKLIDLEAVDHGKKVLTVADHIALRKAQEAVTGSAKTLHDAQAKAQGAEVAAAKATTQHGTVLQQLSDKIKGQANAAADSFTGRMKHLRAEVENQVAEIGKRYGPAITMAGAAMTGLGATMEVASSISSRLRTAKEAESVATAGAATATDVLTGSEVAADAAGIPLALTLGLIVLAVAAVGIGIYELVTHWKAAWGEIKHLADDAIKFLRGPFGTLAVLITGPFAPLILLALHWKRVTTDIVNWSLDAWHGIDGAWQAISRVTSRLYGDVTGFFSRMWRDVTGGVSQGVSTVVKFFQQLPGQLLGALKGAGAWLYDLGKQVVQGLINGIESMAGRAGSILKNVVLSPVHGIKSLLGIHSPSAVFAEIGQNMMAGLAVGISGSGHLPNGALQAVTGNLTGPSLRSGTSGGGTAGRAGGVVQYVTIQVTGSVVGLNEFATQTAPAIRRELIKLVQVNGASGLAL
jgi:hypothetical protein